jgi:hypothetical protein
MVAFQVSIFSTLRFDGTVFMLVWLWPVCVGLTGNMPLAVISAVVGGIFFDTHASTPFGLTSLVGAVLALGASRLGREGVGDLDSTARWVAPFIGAAAGFVAPLLYIIGGFFYLNVELWRGSVLAMMVTNAVVSFFLTRPLARLAYFTAGSDATVRR